MSLSLLDGSVAALKKALPELSLADLQALLEAEKAGNTRKGAVAAIEAAIAALSDEPEPVGDLREITNDVPGFTLHLGDGRRLKHGESALVSPDLYAVLRP